MEKRHKELLRQRFPDALEGRPCICLFIADEFEFMAEPLVAVLHEKMRDHFPELV